MQHRYELEKYNGMASRYTCLECRQKGKFVLYVDAETKEPIAHHVGKCERVDRCGYHFTPKQYFEANGLTQVRTPYIAPIAAVPKRPSFIDNAVFAASLKNYDQNNFFIYLTNLFGTDKASGLASSYYLGTSKKFNGGCVFWQVDLKGQIHTGKIMGYNVQTGKRVKQPFDQITWAHTALKESNFGLNQCLFGLHLLTDQTKAIAVVESEKTAIIASAYLPQFIWLATSGKTQFTKAKCGSLKGLKVVLYPDLGGFEDWQKIAKENGFACSDLLERKATDQDKAKGLDIADYLIKLNVKDFASAAVLPEGEPAVANEIPKIFEDPLPPTKSREAWEVPSFDGIKLPEVMILTPSDTILNVKACIESHLTTINANLGNKGYLPYLKRLNAIHQTLTK